MTGRSHPRHDLVDLLLNPVRLSILAALDQTDDIDFYHLQQQLEVSAPVLSKANTALEEVGFITIHKTFVGRGGRTWLAITPAGRVGLSQHMAALHRIAASS